MTNGEKNRKNKTHKKSTHTYTRRKNEDMRYRTNVRLLILHNFAFSTKLHPPLFDFFFLPYIFPAPLPAFSFRRRSLSARYSIRIIFSKKYELAHLAYFSLIIRRPPPPTPDEGVTRREATLAIAYATYIVETRSASFK